MVDGVQHLAMATLILVNMAKLIIVLMVKVACCLLMYMLSIVSTKDTELFMFLPSSDMFLRSISCLALFTTNCDILKLITLKAI